MPVIYGQIKALNSEASLTSSQEDQENEVEPRICFNPDCLYPLGPACAECSLEFAEKENRRVERRSATRWKSTEEDTNRLVTPTNEEIGQDRLGSITSLSNASIDTFVPNPRNKKSFRHLTDIYPDTKSRESFTDFRAGIRKDSQKSRPSSSSSSSSTATIVEVEATPKRTSAKAESILSLTEEPETIDEPAEISDLTHDFERLLAQDIVPIPIENWLESIPEPIPETWTENPQKLTRKYPEPSSPESQKSIHEQPTRQSPPKIRRRRTQQNELCPLCSNPIGDPKDQHLVKCQFAHDERDREERAKQAALARGQKWG
ncbi:hypothetical protein HYFRA_00010211 [Hymenoscyphus fraxineus]|uniref:Uncharacterized protein n=1 Tax=Hymenoscyphus fraxineus TaxID=746836 RepID=A0A9N9KUR3_9HELO|nr:hypothetical protein HYFRA_00010211 [Hymenoscyphus fraxineus]